MQVVGAGGAGELSGVSTLSAGEAHSLALKADGSVWAWGDNTGGQLGDGTTTQRTSPVQVVGVGGGGYLTGVVAASAGEGHSLAAKANGTVFAWGTTARGSWGMEATHGQRHAGAGEGWGSEQGYLSGVAAVSGGQDHSLALKSDGTVWAWG